MEPEFLNIDEVAEYLGVKRSTVYAWAGARKIPCYRFGRLVRFKKQEIDSWAKERRQDWVSAEKTAKKMPSKIGRKNLDVGEIIRKSIDNVKQEHYNNPNGKPDRIKGLGKEVPDGTL